MRNPNIDVVNNLDPNQHSNPELFPAIYSYIAKGSEKFQLMDIMVIYKRN